jgi:hypothetical protein
MKAQQWSERLGQLYNIYIIGVLMKSGAQNRPVKSTELHCILKAFSQHEKHARIHMGPGTHISELNHGNTEPEFLQLFLPRSSMDADPIQH